MPISKSIKIYSFFLFLLFLTSMGCWIGWGHKTMTQSILGFFLLVIASAGKISFCFSQRNMVLCLVFYFSYIIVSLSFSARVILTQFTSYFIPIICIICLRNEYKVIALKYITKWYAWMLIPSLLLFFLSLKGTPIYLNIISPSEEVYGGYYNLFFYVKPIRSIADFSRFNGPFVEPGHLGMMGSFLLMANLFDFSKKENKIILFSIIVCLSLAGYVLSLIGFLMCSYYQGRYKISNVFIYSIFLLIFFVGGTTYNNGDNLVNEKIFQRLEPDEERGIAGNNRANRFVLEMYANMSSDIDLILWGYSKHDQYLMSDQLKHSNGYQYFLVRNGLVNLIIAFSFYMLLIYYAKEKKYAFLFFLFVVLCFSQRTYPFWFAWIFCYNYGICTNDNLLEDCN